jgi:hypothetical protein
MIAELERSERFCKSCGCNASQLLVEVPAIYQGRQADSGGSIRRFPTLDGNREDQNRDLIGKLDKMEMDLV